MTKIRKSYEKMYLHTQDSTIYSDEFKTQLKNYINNQRAQNFKDKHVKNSILDHAQKHKIPIKEALKHNGYSNKLIKELFKY